MADLNEELNKLNNTKDTTNEYTQDDVNANKLMAALSYLSILVLIPLFAAKESRFARFHVNQGVILFIIEIAVNVVTSILGGIPLIGFILNLAGDIINLACFILTVVGIINVVNGKAKELPLVGGFKIVK